MPAKLKPDELPASIRELKNLCDAQHGRITKESIMTVPRTVRTKAYTAHGNALNINFQSKYDDYAINSDKQKREWLASYAIDPESGGAIENVTERAAIHEVDTVKV